MSPMLLKVITTDLVDCLTPDILNRLSCQFARSSTILQEADGLITLVVHLICKSGSGAFKLFQFVLETAAPNLEERDSQSYVVTLPHVQQCAALILDLLLLDLQRNVYSKSFGKTEVTEIPFLMELQRHSNDLCRFILTATNKRLYWIERLLSVIGVHCGESCASDILCYLLINASSQDKASQVKLFLNLQADFESCLPDVMQTAVQNSLYSLQHITDKQGNGFLFGGKLDANELTMKVPEPKVSLQKENEKHALSVTLPATASTVFHAGIIGQGLKPKVVNKIPPQPRLMQNIQSVLDVLYLCGCDDRCVDGEISESSATTMAELLVDSICPDVTHAGVIWPDEEFMKYTVERDLHIKRSFEDNPILMHILKIIAKAKPILCKCTVLVYGLLATLINYWEANREKKSSLSPKKLHISSELVHCMALADFLPPSLGLVCELFYMLTPYEVFLLLMNIWTFMKENPPAEDCYLTKDKYGRRSRVFEAVDAKYTKLLHSVLHHNIEMCGHFYSRIFPVSQT
ncbi:integrator complex subunit 5-like [Saccoglossus kowalevskii]